MSKLPFSVEPSLSLSLITPTFCDLSFLPVYGTSTDSVVVLTSDESLFLPLETTNEIVDPSSTDFPLGD